MKKLNLGSGITTVSGSARPTHPTVKADGETQVLLDQFALINPQYKTLKNQSETISKQLAGPIRRMFWSQWEGREAESSTMIVVAGNTRIKLTTKNAYPKTLTDESLLVTVLGDELVSRHFRQATVLKIELEKFPENNQEAFAAGVIKLAEELGGSDAVTATQCIQPRAGFHESRSSILTVDQNVRLDEILPVVAYPQI